MDGWRPIGAALEYWFFRTSWPGGALLVDVIRRRNAPLAELRVASCWRGVGRVDRAWVSPGTADSILTGQQSSGAVGDVAWNLTFVRGQASIVAPPPPLRPLRPFDLSLVSWPQVACTGVARVGGVEHTLAAAPGMACHYGGRRLPDRWLWLSASTFDRPGFSAEAGLLTSRLWGIPAPLPPLGYAWLRQPEGDRYVASPLTGVVRRVRGRRTGGVRIAVVGARGGWSLTAAASASSFVDLGDGIAQSLSADCLLRTAGTTAVARGTAVLELRDRRWATVGLPR